MAYLAYFQRGTLGVPAASCYQTPLIVSPVAMQTSTAALWQPLHETVGEFRAECSTLEHLVESLFGELDGLRGQLTTRLRELDQQRMRLAERQTELARQRDETHGLSRELAQRDAQLTDALAALELAKGEVERHRQSLRESAQDHDVAAREQIAGLEAAKVSLAAELEAAREELAKKSSLAEKLTAAQAQLAAAEQRLAHLNEPPVSAAVVPAPHIEELAHERDELERELELVRVHAAEMEELFAEHKLEAARQQHDMISELKQLRQLVQKEVELDDDDGLLKRAGSAGPPPRITVAARAAEPAVMDPVVNSVMAQFAKLQKDMADRRRRRP